MAKSATIIPGSAWARPGATVAAQLVMPKIRTSRVLPTRSTSRSASAVPSTSPTGIAKSAMPRMPSDRCACALAAGERAHHPHDQEGRRYRPARQADLSSPPGTTHEDAIAANFARGQSANRWQERAETRKTTLILPSSADSDHDHEWLLA